MDPEERSCVERAQLEHATLGQRVLDQEVPRKELAPTDVVALPRTDSDRAFSARGHASPRIHAFPAKRRSRQPADRKSSLEPVLRPKTEPGDGRRSRPPL